MVGGSWRCALLGWAGLVARPRPQLCVTRLSGTCSWVEALAPLGSPTAAAPGPVAVQDVVSGWDERPLEQQQRLFRVVVMGAAKVVEAGAASWDAVQRRLRHVLQREFV